MTYRIPLQLRRADSWHVHGRPFVEATLQGPAGTVTTWALLDTGSSSCFFTPEVARSLGYVLCALPRGQVAGVTGAVEKSRVLPLRSVSLGAATVHNELATVADRNIIGMSWLGRFARVTLGLAGGVLELEE